MADIFIYRGFDSEKIEMAKKLLSSLGENPQALIFRQVTKAMLDKNVEKLLTDLDGNNYREDSTEEAAQGNPTVIMASTSKERALKVMRALKSVMDDPGSAAFAFVTQTSLSWTLGYYINHVNKEHEYMKTHNPANDPDMKKIN